MGVPPDMHLRRVREQQAQAQRGADDGAGGGSAGGAHFELPASEPPPAADAVRSLDVVWSLDHPGDLGARLTVHPLPFTSTFCPAAQHTCPLQAQKHGASQSVKGRMHAAGKLLLSEYQYSTLCFSAVGHCGRCGASKQA